MSDSLKDQDAKMREKDRALVRRNTEIEDLRAMLEAERAKVTSMEPVATGSCAVHKCDRPVAARIQIKDSGWVGFCAPHGMFYLKADDPVKQRRLELVYTTDPKDRRIAELEADRNGWKRECDRQAVKIAELQANLSAPEPGDEAVREAYARGNRCAVGGHDGHPEEIIQKDSAWQAFADRCTLVHAYRASLATIRELREHLGKNQSDYTHLLLERTALEGLKATSESQKWGQEKRAEAAEKIARDLKVDVASERHQKREAIGLYEGEKELRRLDKEAAEKANAELRAKIERMSHDGKTDRAMTEKHMARAEAAEKRIKELEHLHSVGCPCSAAAQAEVKRLCEDLDMVKNTLRIVNGGMVEKDRLIESARHAVGVFFHHWKHGGISQDNHFHQQTARAMNEFLDRLARAPADMKVGGQKSTRESTVNEARLVTDAWFDGDQPNPLHPVGVIIDPITRSVDVPVEIGHVVLSHGIQGRIATGHGLYWRARVNDTIILNAH